MNDENDFSFRSPPRGISDFREMKPATLAEDEAGPLWGIFASLVFIAVFIIVSLGIGELLTIWADRIWRHK